MTIKVKILVDSINQQGNRLTTFELVYHRTVHSEVMTHRVFSRNASSSRAVPIKRLIQEAMDNPAVPLHWGAHQPGMQAHLELTGRRLDAVKSAWFHARDAAVEQATYMAQEGAAKQLVNRLLEPFTHIKVVCSATEYENFFALRRHEDAQPEIKMLADLMWEAREASTPNLLLPGQWHLPYTTDDDWIAAGELEASTGVPSHDIVKKISCAMLARTSYNNHDGTKRDILKDIALHDKLLVQTPLHASPAEHIATPDAIVQFDDGYEWRNDHEHKNFRGWRQYRAMLPHEFVPG